MAHHIITTRLSADNTSSHGVSGRLDGGETRASEPLPSFSFLSTVLHYAIQSLLQLRARRKAKQLVLLWKQYTEIILGCELVLNGNHIKAQAEEKLRRIAHTGNNNNNNNISDSVLPAVGQWVATLLVDEADVIESLHYSNYRRSLGDGSKECCSLSSTWALLYAWLWFPDGSSAASSTVSIDGQLHREKLRLATRLLQALLPSVSKSCPASDDQVFIEEQFSAVLGWLHSQRIPSPTGDPMSCDVWCALQRIEAQRSGSLAKRAAILGRALKHIGSALRDEEKNSNHTRGRYTYSGSVATMRLLREQLLLCISCIELCVREEEEGCSKGQQMEIEKHVATAWAAADEIKEKYLHGGDCVEGGSSISQLFMFVAESKLQLSALLIDYCNALQRGNNGGARAPCAHPYKTDMHHHIVEAYFSQVRDVLSDIRVDIQAALDGQSAHAPFLSNSLAHLLSLALEQTGLVEGHASEWKRSVEHLTASLRWWAASLSEAEQQQQQRQQQQQQGPTAQQQNRASAASLFPTPEQLRLLNQDDGKRFVTIITALSTSLAHAGSAARAVLVIREAQSVVAISSSDPSIEMESFLQLTVGLARLLWHEGQSAEASRLANEVLERAAVSSGGAGGGGSGLLVAMNTNHSIFISRSEALDLLAEITRRTAPLISLNYLRAALHGRRLVLGEFHPDVVLACVELGHGHLRSGRPSEALHWARDAMSRVERYYHHNHREGCAGHARDLDSVPAYRAASQLHAQCIRATKP